ncbi:MAG: hypothetical protein ACNYPH_02335 [Gammaproteobacteria bacterium WSBS_2016_MAG_OTU1]
MLLALIWSRQTRNAHSIARNDMSIAQYDLTRAEEEEVAADELSALKQDLQTKTAAERLLATQLQDWKLNSYYVSIIILILLLLEAALMPRSIRLAKNRRKYTVRAPPCHTARTFRNSDQWHFFALDIQNKFNDRRVCRLLDGDSSFCFLL